MEFGILSEALGAILSAIKPDLSDMKKDIKDLRRAVKAIVKHLDSVSNDADKSLDREKREFKRKLRLQTKHSKEIRDLGPLATGKEYFRRG